MMRRTWSLRGKVRWLPASISLMAALLLCKLVLLALGGVGPAALNTARRALLPTAAASTPADGAASRPAAQAPAGAHPPAARAPAPAAAPPAPLPDSGPSEAERALLQDLRARRTAIEAREQGLGAREAMVTAAEKRLAERVEQLATMQARLEALDQTRRERDEANWRGLVKTYEAMRPRDAAAIFNDLEQPVLMQVLDRMKEAKAALILAAMQPERARAATAQLAQWRSRAAGGSQG